jgi:hypothetical protein
MSVSEAFSSNVVVELLSSERLMDYWASLERDLLRHRDVWEERLTLEHIQRNCANGHYQVWLVGNREQVYLTIYISDI